MKKCIAGLICCLICFISCEVPQSVTIKGTPGLYVPLGSPFKEGEGLVDKISPDAIREMMSTEADTSHTLKIYEYRGSLVAPDVLAYAVHYPIVDMQLDLDEYLNGAMEATESSMSYKIPDQTAAIPQIVFDSQYPNGIYFTGNGTARNHVNGNPLFSIDLTDMTKLVTSITGTAFGLQIDYNENFEKYLSVYIPALGIGTPGLYAKGTRNGGKLRFVQSAASGSEIIMHPQTDIPDGKIDVYVKLSGPCSGTFKLENAFEWTSAILNTADNDKLSGEYKIENALGDFLGSGVAFSNINGYIYAQGIDTAATITLTAGAMDLGVPANSPLTARDVPPFQDDKPYSGTLTPHSLAQPLALDSVMNATSATTLLYNIKIPQMTINKNASNTKRVRADMVILLPLELEISTPVTAPGYSERYVKLDLGEAYTKTGDKDIFGRTGTSDDDLFSSLESVTIALKDTRITVIDKNSLAILVKANNNIELITFDSDKPSLTLEKKWFQHPPFSPGFEIFLKKDTGKNYATFKVKRQDDDPQFDFNLVLEARAAINQTIEL